MIKLKHLLLENDKWYPAHTKQAITWATSHTYIPLYPKQMERLVGKQQVNSFHVTSPISIKNVGELLGKKKSISTFTRANKGSQLAKGRGVQTGSGGVIFYLEGTLLARHYIDFDTVPDKRGMRWIPARYATGDALLFQNYIKKQGIPDAKTWRDLEWETSEKIQDDNSDLPYREVMNLTKIEMNKEAQKLIKKHIDASTKFLKKHKDKVIKNLRTPADKGSAWWNEVLVYGIKVIDVFVLKRVWDDYYFQKDSGYDDDKKDSYKKELFKFVPESKVTVGTPAQFRKWYNAREGILDD